MADRRSFRRPRSLRLSRRGWATLVVGVLAIGVAYSVDRSELLVVGCAAIALVGSGLVWARLRRPKLDVLRAFTPPVVSATRAARVTLVIRNRGVRATIPALWNDALPWYEPAEPQPLPPIAPLSAAAPSSAAAASGRSATLRYTLHPQRRGRYPVGPLAIEFADPFGMSASVVAVGDTDELVVVPAVSDLPGGALSVADAEGSALLVQRRVTGNDDDLTTREYRIGDAMRRVHWRASARHGELMVRQEEQRSFPEARIVIDCRRDGYADVDTTPGFSDLPTVQSESFEWVVRMLASLGVHLTDAGFQVDIHESIHPQVAPFGERWEGGRREEAFLTSLAGIRLRVPTPGEGAGDSASDGGGPVFALLSAPSDDTLRWVLRHRRPGEVAVAFLAGDPRHTRPAAELLHDGGWLCVPVDQDADPADAWAAAHQGWGAIRAGR